MKAKQMSVRGSRVRGLIAALTTVFVMVPVLFVSVQSATASSTGAAASLGQCTNGPVGAPPTPQPCQGSNVAGVTVDGVAYKNWVNGNSNGSKSHWKENQFIPYRVNLSGLSAGSHTLVVHYVPQQSGLHAIDYLGNFDQTESTSLTSNFGPPTFSYNKSNPCSDFTAAGSFAGTCTTPPSPQATLAIPGANLGGGSTICTAPGTFNPASSQIPGSIKLFGPTGSTLSYPTAASSSFYASQNVVSGGGACDTTVSFKFSVPAAVDSRHNVVIAWGGHIASEADWGHANSASFISGSPFHMALDSLDGASTGSQDRALSANAIFFTPSIATLLSSSSIAVGGTVHDSATLSLASPAAGGTVTYSVYTNDTCTTLATTQISAQPGTVTVTNGSVPDSGNVTFNTAGTYYFQAAYSGDSQDLAAKSPCTSETIVVGRVGPSVATLLSSSAISVGDTVHDSATISGATSNAGGTVTYSVYTNNTCTTLATTQISAQPGTVTVTNGSVPNSGNVTFNTAGTYYFQAAYSGDVSNDSATSACTSETIVVSRVSPSIATLLSSSSISVGDTVHDSATLSGATSNAGGTVTYSVYTNNTCTTPATTQISGQPGAVTVTSGSVPNSANVTFNTAGTYYFQAAYTGDINNNSATSPCTSETIVVGRVSPSIATLLSTSETSIGTAVHDSATLSGATANAGGTVTYSVYTNDTCTTLATTQISGQPGTVTVTSGSVPNSANVTFNTAGTYYFQAAYTGDTNNNGAASPCTSETIVIDKNGPSIATLLSTSETSIGTAVHDSATLSGATSNAGGTVTYSVYTNNTCTTLATTQISGQPGTVTVTSGSVPNSANVTFNTAGTYYFQAAYTGDTNNNGAASPCTSETIVIDKNKPGLSTAQNLMPNDTGTLTGATTGASGTITFALFSPADATCSSTPALTQTVNVNGNGAYATTNTSFVASDPGEWRWQVIYSGDGNNDGQVSACGVENFTITNG